jgi:hypothetical protein
VIEKDFRRLYERRTGGVWGCIRGKAQSALFALLLFTSSSHQQPRTATAGVRGEGSSCDRSSSLLLMSRFKAGTLVTYLGMLCVLEDIPIE